MLGHILLGDQERLQSLRLTSPPQYKRNVIQVKLILNLSFVLFKQNRMR